MGLERFLKYNHYTFPIYLFSKDVKLFFTNKILSDERYLKRLFKKYQGYHLDFRNPKTLNEKLQWLKIYDRKEVYSIYADKFAARDFIKDTFGERWLIPLVLHTTDYRDLQPENLPDYPCVIKTNHGFGNTYILRDKTKTDWEKLRLDFKGYLRTNYYYYEREWQYKSIKPRIIIEKMLLTIEGKIPNDYKLNFIEGELEFIYVSVDREGENKRNIYDKEWNPMDFTWARRGKDLYNIKGKEISPPLTLQTMIEFGTIIAKLFKYVRVDFYDVDGILYFGEITQCHGGGFDQMLPFKYDVEFGKKISLPDIHGN